MLGTGAQQCIASKYKLGLRSHQNDSGNGKQRGYQQFLECDRGHRPIHGRPFSHLKRLRGLRILLRTLVRDAWKLLAN